MEDTKLRERHYHDELRGEFLPTGDPKYTAYQKWYYAGYKAFEWLEAWVRDNAMGKTVLDYGTGRGQNAIKIAGFGGRVVGTDISSVSLQIARTTSVQAGTKAAFLAMDNEQTAFRSGTFDIVVCCGVLHHLDVARAFQEIARILKPDGTVIALEGLGHNPFINWYRDRTPYLRSPDEHPLLMDDLQMADEHFRNVQVRFFNLATLAAAPFWKTPLCRPLVTLLQPIDQVLLRLPLIQRQAWMAGLLLSGPKVKDAAASP